MDKIQAENAKSCRFSILDFGRKLSFYHKGLLDITSDPERNGIFRILTVTFVIFWRFITTHSFICSLVIGSRQMILHLHFRLFHVSHFQSSQVNNNVSPCFAFTLQYSSCNNCYHNHALSNK